MRLNFDCTPGREFRRPFLRRWALLLAFTMGGALVPAGATVQVDFGDAYSPPVYLPMISKTGNGS